MSRLLVGRGKTACSVEVLMSAIQAAVKGSLSSSRTAPNTPPWHSPYAQAVSTALANFGHKECLIHHLVAAGPPLCLLWGHFLPKPIQ
jgi:hypothetical protein